ncbi:type II toxin-antitoxin system RelB family antitoxin [Methylobacterium sp. sgz302541]|uniref:type II toxin-antitoxin system RelB family antitoxin n=1 Tax=unclassified Methylobacterium TaxID=2615210 RepID=UPI003D3527BB
MLALDLPPDVERRLDALARRTGRSRDEHAREAILEHLEALEDLALAESRLEALRRGASDTIPLEAVMSRHGVAD